LKRKVDSFGKQYRGKYAPVGKVSSVEHSTSAVEGGDRGQRKKNESLFDCEQIKSYFKKEGVALECRMGREGKFQ
jgi:hypothetical protein